MGKLLNTQEIVEKNIETYNKTAVSEYSKYFEGTPSFVTYYSRDILNSTRDETLEDVNEVIGVESPVIYNKIENFTIYGLDAFTPNLNKEDYGYETNVEGEAMILPATIRPLSHDFINIFYAEKEYLLEVTEVNNERLDGKSFYKIGFKLSSKSIEEIENQTKSDTYTEIFENVGTKENAIIHKKIFEIISYIRGIKDHLIDDYNLKYFNSRYNIHNFKINDMNIYNQPSAYFLQKTGVFRKNDSFSGNVHIEDILNRDMMSDLEYKKSIYYAVEKGNISSLCIDGIKLSRIVAQYTPFHYTYEEYFNISFIENLDDDYQQTNNVMKYRIFDNLFLEKIKNNELYEDDEHLFENIIIKYLNINKLEDYSEKDIIELLDKLNDYEYYFSLENFIIIPVIIYILEQIRYNLDKRKYL